MVFKENMVSEIGRACLIEIGCKSRWWSRCRHICSKFVLLELVNLICLREVSVNGMVNLRRNVDGEGWKRSISVSEYKSVVGEHGKMVSMTQKGRKSMKEKSNNESFADGSVGAKVRLMVRGDVCP